MGPSDRKTFGLEIGLLADVLRWQPISSPAIEVYFEELQSYKIDEVIAAIRYWRGHEPRFPAPVDLKDQVRSLRRLRLQERRALTEAPPSPEEQEKVHRLIRETIAKLSVGDAL